MAAITAAMVSELRAKTDAPMMECKKALTEADGDMAKAEEILRVKLGNKASKAASRVAAEGVVATFIATDGKSFWLMPKVLRLGTAYLYSARLPRVVQPFLQRLTGATQESAFVAILDDDDVVYIARNGANRVMNVGFVLGARISPFVSSAGIALLSAEPRQRTTTLLERYETKPHTPHTITDKGELFALVERAALQGYATLEQQLEPGVRGIAVPLKNHRAETVGAISISARIGNESSEDALRRLLVPLQQLAFELREVV